jgi:CRISPR system Cascade subunit CasA
MSHLDPLFVEAARPVRISTNGHELQALGATTSSRQIAGPDSGDCGDPWTVLNIADKKKGVSALTVSSQGLTPKLLADLLFQQGFQLTELQQPRPGSGRTYFCASVLVRGQGTTDGFHAAQIPIPETARAALLQPNRRDKLALFARELLSDASTIEKCLRSALMTLAEGGPAKPDYGKDAVVAWANKAIHSFAHDWRHDYFPALWEATDAVSEHRAIRARWVEGLMAQARRLLGKAEQHIPIPSSRRMRAAVRAQSLLEALFHKQGLIALSREAADAVST